MTNDLCWIARCSKCRRIVRGTWNTDRLAEWQAESAARRLDVEQVTAEQLRRDMSNDWGCECGEHE